MASLPVSPPVSPPISPAPRPTRRPDPADPHQSNNFDALRLFAATLVIFSHAFLLAQGNQQGEPLLALTGQAVLGLIGVFIFFVISGYLVSASYENTASLPRFLMKRALRIFPGLWICLALSTFGLGCWLTRLPLASYLRDPGSWAYLWHNALLEVSVNTLPGVKFTDFADGWNVNGPLWSLPFEAMMYVMVAVLGRTGGLRGVVLVPLFLFGIGCGFLDTRDLGDLPHGFLWLLGFFAAGMVGYRLRGPWLHDRRLGCAALLGLVIAARAGWLNPLFPIFGGFLILHLALDPRLPLVPAARFGDLSYGLYIYGWPVQQTVAHFGLVWWAKPLAWWQVFLLAWPIAALIAFCSWHCVEKPALRLKPASKTGGRS